MAGSEADEMSLLVHESGIPAAIRDTRRPCEKQLALYLILTSILFERIAFYSLVANLVVTLQSPELLDWNSRDSLTALFIFSGTSYISTLIFATISDAELGRAKTIIIGFILYLIGYILVTIIARGDTSLCNINNHRFLMSIHREKCAPAILGALITTAIGAGAVKSNMAVFGAEQIQQSEIASSRYFDKYICAVNIGSTLAILAVPYIQNSPQHYFTGYLVAASLLLVSAILFLIGRRFSVHAKPYDSVITNCIPVLVNALRTWFKYRKSERVVNEHWANLSSRSHSLTAEQLTRMNEKSATFLDYAKASNHGKFPDRMVNDVKSLRNAIMVFILLIPYWLIYDQIHTAFYQQGQQMKNSSGKKLVIWMSLGDPITIILGVLILNIFVYRYFDSRIRANSIIIKFFIGMTFACITMCTAGTVEISRQSHCPQHTNISNLSIFTQLPQNIFMGFAELFGTVASYEFAYFAAPRSGQSLFMSLHFCSAGVSSFIGTAYIYIFPTTSDDLNFSCLSEKPWSFYTYFYILAALQLIFILLFFIINRKFRIIKINPQQVTVRH